MSRPLSPFPDVFVRTPELAARIDRGLKAKRIRKIAPGLYTSDITLPLETLVRRNLWSIATLLFPRAVITDRTAFEAGPSADGSIFLAAEANRDVALPGITLRARKGAGPLPGDTPFLGLHMASRARAYLENVPATRARNSIARRLSRRELEARLERDLADKGESYLQSIRDDARKLATALELTQEFATLDGLIGTLLGTRNAALQSAEATARAAGKAYDARRLDLFTALHTDLLKLAPAHRAALPGEDDPQYLPFFEAYFSNFIEGTEFEPDEAAAIIFEGRFPIERPEDAHDILGTYRVVANRAEMRRTAKTFEELLVQLRTRHASVMEGRADKSPGAFKTMSNRAGSTTFVAPELVIGTLARGFELARALPEAFQRAVFMMFLVSEVHPFTDGNGRVARIMMNAELIAANECRIIVPTIFRSNYLSGLKALSQNGVTNTLVRALDFLQRYTLAVNFSTYDGAKRELEETHAFLDPRVADEEGIRLRLP